MVRVTEFDPSAFLDDDEVVADYLTAALEDDNPDIFLAAVDRPCPVRSCAGPCDLPRFPRSLALARSHL
jgi:hypothetical protein